MIFVFGSNLAGIHGAGAAHVAYKQYGAIRGIGFGPSGFAYAIPTKDAELHTLPLDQVTLYVAAFKLYATTRNLLQFKVTRIGCGLAGYRDCDIAPMFKDAPLNCYMDEIWKPFMLPDRKYWGTYEESNVR